MVDVQGIESDDQVTKDEGKEFRQLMETHWKNRVSKAANRRKALRRLNKPELLPLTEDLLKLKVMFEVANNSSKGCIYLTVTESK